MGPPGKRAFIQLVAVLLASGALRTAWGHRSTGLEDLPGDPVSLNALADSAARLAESEARRSRPLDEGERLDPNRAPEEELDRLPGVGPSTARALVHARDSLPFRSLDELVRVRGIGERTAERLRQHLTLASVPAVTAGRPRGGAVGKGGRREPLNPVGTAGAPWHWAGSGGPDLGAQDAARCLPVTRGSEGGFRDRTGPPGAPPGAGPIPLTRCRGPISPCLTRLITGA